ncbi:ribonuclease-like [Rhineura floridana]|uniref:ribonuclease-like n=1 Tax=Rhineura floridana TaxID=261503 RepID=UPI002AC889A1|nr:ribonuclease-like [Rhineura floridana]
MSPKGLGPQALLLLFVLTVATLCPNSEATTYGDFLKRHLDNPKSDFQNDNTYCNLMMSRRNLNCQRGNTFIHASEQQLISICNSRGKVLEGNQTSKTLFPITICTLSKGPRRVFCRYNGKSKIRKIRVTCEKGLPVHYITHA